LREGFLQWLEETVLPDLRSGAGVAGPSTGSPEARP
jgi:hypothetical protein